MYKAFEFCIISVFLCLPTFGEVMGSSPSHGRGFNSGGFNNGGFGGGGFNNSGFGGNGFGGGGFGGGGFGGGFGGGGGGTAQKNDKRDESIKIGEKTGENINKVSEKNTAAAEKRDQAFFSSLDKLNPEDKTAELLKEYNEAAERYSEMTRGEGEAGAIVDNIIKQIGDVSNTVKQQFIEVAIPFTTPIGGTSSTQSSGTATSDRIREIPTNRATNPLAVAMGAEPPGNHSGGTSIPGSISQGQGFLNSKRQVRPYNAPDLK